MFSNMCGPAETQNEILGGREFRNLTNTHSNSQAH